jgi:hypothetical protein
MIPKEWEGKSFYEILGIMRDARFEDIRTSYRRLVRAYHPDLAPGTESQENFRAVTLAYQVLGDPKLRAQYDEYFFTDSRENAEHYRKPKPYMRLFIRTALFILILLLLKNLGYLGTTNIFQNLGTSQTTNSGGSNNNEVLALMAGPQGPPGPAGVAGRNGFIGMNGYQGTDGLPGAPGAVGAQGPAGVAGEIGPAGAAGSAGTAGAAGAAGAQGLQGLQGLPGQGVTLEPISTDEADCDGAGGVRIIGTTTAIVCNGTGTGIIGAGYVNVGACDSSVKITLESTFKNGEFKMSAINVNQLSGACNGQELTAILKIKSTFSSDGLIRNHYIAGDAIRCSKSLVLNPDSGVDANNIQLSWQECQNITTPDGDFRLDDVYAYDVSASARGLLIQIAEI